MEFIKNDLINETIDVFIDTWSHLKDTPDIIDEKYLKKIDKFIFKNLKKKFNEINIYDLIILEEQGYKLSFFQRLKVKNSGLKSLYEYQKSQLNKEDIKEYVLEKIQGETK